MTLLKTTEFDGFIGLDTSFSDALAFISPSEEKTSGFLFVGIPSYDKAAYEKILSRYGVA